MNPNGRSLEDQTILVTGGAGFLGVHVARALAQRRARLILQDTTAKRMDLLAPVLSSRRADFLVCPLAELNQASALLNRLPQVDYVVHLGLTVPDALSADPADAVAQYQAANLEPFARLLERLPARLRGVVLASSVSVYGPPGAHPVTELHPARGQTPYALTKLAMEAALADFSARRVVPVTTLRYSTLFGPGEINSLRAIPSFIRNLVAGQPPVIHGDGSEVHDYLYVADAAEGTCLALEHLAGAAGLYNIGSGHGWTTRAVAETIQRLLQVALPPKYMPARGPRNDLIADPGHAGTCLGFYPETPLEAGLAAEIAYYRSQAGVRSPAQDDTHGLLARASAHAAGR